MKSKDTVVCYTHRDIPIYFMLHKKMFRFNTLHRQYPIEAWTLLRAIHAIDKIHNAEELIGKTLLCTSSRDGEVFMGTITELKLIPGQGSERLQVEYYDEKGRKFPSAGPFFDASPENIKLTTQIAAIKSEQHLLHDTERKLWKELSQKRIDKI